MTLEKVLLVEDEMILSLNLKILLKSMGVQVIDMAGNGRQTKDKLQKTRYDLVFMDIRLPGGESGVELARMVNDFYPGTKIIFLSASRDEAILTGLKDIEYLTFLSKPYTNEQVKTIIEKVEGAA